MIQQYLILKAKTGYCRFITDKDVFNAYLFKDSIQEIDIEKITDIELRKMEFKVPIVLDEELFNSSSQKEGFGLKTVKLNSIREFKWLDSPQMW